MRTWLGYPTAALPLAILLGLFIGQSASERIPPQRILPALHAVHAATAEAPGDFEEFTYTRWVSCVEALGDRVWVGTYGGLVELERGTQRFVRLYTVADGLPDLVCRDMRAVGDALWIAGPAGLVRFEPGAERFEVVHPTPVGRFVHQPERHVLWALDYNQGAVRVDLATGDVQCWPDTETDDCRIVDDEFWTVGDREEGECRNVRWLEPLTGQTRSVDISGLSPRDTEGRLWPAGRSVWVTFGSYYSKGPGIGRIDRESGRLRVYREDDGLPGSFVPYMASQGEDLWAASFAEEVGQRHLEGCLARFKSGTGEWERHPTLSGARFDAPTAIKECDGDLWVATQGYDETREMIVGWGMVPFKHEAPVVKHLALSRWLPETRTWEVHRFPDEHNYSEVTDFWMTADDIWMAISRTDTGKSSHSDDEPQGTWLASCPRAGGDLAWHFPLTQISVGDDYPNQIENVYVADDTIWAYQRAELRYFDRQAASMRKAEWPCRLPVYDVQAIAATGDEVWLGTNDGELLSLDRPKAVFEVQGRATVSGTKRVSSPGMESGPAGREKAKAEAPTSTSRWGPAVRASISGLVFGPDSSLWVTCTTRCASLYFDSRPDAFVPPSLAPSGLLQRSGDSWAVPSLGPWSRQHRGENGENRFVPPPLPGKGSLFSQIPIIGALFARGEAGVACVLPESERLWVGTLSDGLYLLEGEHWQRLGPLPPQELPATAVEPVAEQVPEPEAEPAVAEQQAAVESGFAPGMMGREPEGPPCRPDDLVVALARLGESLYVATAEHLYRFDIPAGEWHTIGPADFAPLILKGPHPERWSLNKVRGGRDSFLIELDGDLWMPGRIGAERAGLYRLRAEANEAERVFDDRPLAAAAHGGWLWVCTEEGLVRLDPATGEQWLLSVASRSRPHVAAIAAHGDVLWVSSTRAVTRLTVDEFERRAEAVGGSPR